MVLLIFYVWVIDLFLYSNTEIFIIFFIFSSFGVLFYSLVVWYSEYLDELIIAENQKIYLLIFSLRKKISLLKIIVTSNKVTISGRPMKFLPVISYNYNFVELFNAFHIFSEILYYANFANFCFSKYKNYVVYLKTLLTQLYKFNLSQNRVFVGQKFLNFYESVVTLGDSNLGFAQQALKNKIFSAWQIKFFRFDKNFINFLSKQYIYIYTA